MEPVDVNNYVSNSVLEISDSSVVDQQTPTPAALVVSVGGHSMSQRATDEGFLDIQGVGLSRFLLKMGSRAVML